MLSKYPKGSLALSVVPVTAQKVYRKFDPWERGMNRQDGLAIAFESSSTAVLRSLPTCRNPANVVA